MWPVERTIFPVLLLIAGYATPALAQSPPSIAKQFNPSTIPLSATTSLDFTITNPNPSTTLTGVAFFDALPTGLTVVDSTTTVCSGTLTTTSPGTIQLAGASLNANSQCQFSVTVTATAIGQFTNSTGVITSSNGGTGNFATATLIVTLPSAPSIAKQFNPSRIPLNFTSSLAFTITNPNPSTALVGVGFVDDLPVGLTFTPTTAVVCGGTLATSFSFRIELQGASIAANSTCQFSVTVMGNASGQYTNVSGNVTSTNGGTGNTATANLTVFTLSIARTHDFNFDGMSDILWLNNNSGQVLDWLMNGATVIGGGSPGSTPSPWAIVGQRDFNGDGLADILWRNGTTGQLVVWLVNGSRVVGGGSLGSAANPWSVAGTGDFNGDGFGDILWYNTSTGQLVIWLTHGTSVIGGGSPGSAGSPWTVAGTGDFKGDGRTDILWYNTSTGQAVIWLLNGTSVIGGGSPGSAGSPWTVAGTGDFNGDGMSDILWLNGATGEAVIWLLNGTSVIGGGSPGSAGSPWTIAETGDFNGDSKSDILWFNPSTGQVVLWFLNGASVIGGGSPGSAPSPWLVQGMNAD